jgi:mycofactocin precursor
MNGQSTTQQNDSPRGASVTAPRNVDVSAEEPDGDLLVDELLVDELLVEEISIDGMCGVY